MKELFGILKDLVVSNWWLKLSAILLAMVLWLMARGTEAGPTVTVPLAGHAQSFEKKMNIHPRRDDKHGSPAVVQVRIEPGKISSLCKSGKK